MTPMSDVSIDPGLPDIPTTVREIKLADLKDRSPTELLAFAEEYAA